MQYVFGPVPSRGLGQSLGIDTIALKSCDSNCVYSQLGHTVPLLNERQEYLRCDEILAGIEQARVGLPAESNFNLSGYDDVADLEGDSVPSLIGAPCSGCSIWNKICPLSSVRCTVTSLSHLHALPRGPAYLTRSSHTRWILTRQCLASCAQ